MYVPLNSPSLICNKFDPSHLSCKNLSLHLSTLSRTLASFERRKLLLSFTVFLDVNIIGYACHDILSAYNCLREFFVSLRYSFSLFVLLLLSVTDDSPIIRRYNY